MDPTLAGWAASVIVDDLSQNEITTHHRSKEQAVDHYRAKLVMIGLKVLKKPQLVSLWEYLRNMAFVQEHGLPSIARSAKKQAFIDYITSCFALDGAKGLRPITRSSIPLAAGTPAPGYGVAAMPRAHFSPHATMPSAHFSPHAAMPMAHSSTHATTAQMPPHMHASTAQMPPHSSNPWAQHMAPHASIQGNLLAARQGNQQHNQQQLFVAPGSSPSYQYPNPPFGNGSMQYQPGTPNANQPGNGKPSSSRKRKTPGGPTIEGVSRPPDFAAMMAELQARGSMPIPIAALAANNSDSDTSSDNSGDGGRSAIEKRILSGLLAMGFPDREECLSSIRRLMDKAGKDGPVPTIDNVMCDILAQRDEREFAKDMDDARIASESEKQKETERLREKRKEDEQTVLMNASLNELRDPPKDHCRLMFPESWLLRHEEIIPLLTEIIDRKESDLKKALIEVLQEEKGCRKWYDAGLPKCYFTFAIAKRLQTAHAKSDEKALLEEMQSIVQEVKQGIALPQYQTKDNIPKIFFEAKEEYGASEQAAGQNTADDDDDDDDIIVLNDEEVEQMRSQNNGGRPPLDTANVVVETA